MENANHRVAVIASHLAPQTSSITAISRSNTSAASPLARDSVGFHGGRAVARCLAAHSVKVVFTLTGGHIAPILTGCDECNIRVIDVRDEVTTVFAADAVARLTGIPGIAIVTAGPGLSNTVTAIKNAQMAQSPIIIMAGATSMLLKGRGSLQDVDQLGMVSTLTKWSTSIKRVRDIGPTLRKAFVKAQEGTPGPVFIEYPIETLWPRSMVSQQLGVPDPSKPSSGPTSWGPNGQSIHIWLSEMMQAAYLKRHLSSVFDGGDSFAEVNPARFKYPEATPAEVYAVSRLLATARRPLLLVGSQAVVRASSVLAIADAIKSINIPTYLSGMARGLLGKEHRIMFRHARKESLKNADIIILAGVPADFRLDYGRSLGKNGVTKIVIVNLNHNDLTKNKDLRRANMYLLADAGFFLVALGQNVRINSSIGGENDIQDWFNIIQQREDARNKAIANDQKKPAIAIIRKAEWAALTQTTQAPPGEHILRHQHDKDGNEEMSISPIHNVVSPSADISKVELVNAVHLCMMIDSVLSDDSIVIGDGGDFVGTAAYIVRPRRPLGWLDPGVYGTLGVGGGFACGAKAVSPNSEVWILYGDGSSAYSLSEMDTFCRHNLGVIAVIGNDACWHQMFRDQIKLLGNDVASLLSYTHYEVVGMGYGAEGILIRRNEDVLPGLCHAQHLAKQGRPVVVNVLLGSSDFREGSISL